MTPVGVLLNGQLASVAGVIVSTCHKVSCLFVAVIVHIEDIVPSTLLLALRYKERACPVDSGHALDVKDDAIVGRSVLASATSRSTYSVVTVAMVNAGFASGNARNTTGPVM